MITPAMADPIPLDDAAADSLRPALKLERFFPGRLKAKDARLLFSHSGLYRYAPQEYVIHQGEDTKDLHVVLRGSVAITKTLGTAGAHLATLGPGDIFGEMALVRDGRRVANAIAASAALEFRLAYLDVQGLMAGNPELGEHLKSLAERRSGAG